MFTKLVETVINELIKRVPLLIIGIGVGVFLIGASGRFEAYNYEWLFTDAFGRTSLMVLGTLFSMSGVVWLYTEHRRFQPTPVSSVVNDAWKVAFAAKLMEEVRQNKIEWLREVSQLLPRRLSTHDIVAISQPLQGNDRAEAIEILAPSYPA